MKPQFAWAKKIIFVLAISLTLSACKKEDTSSPTPIPTPTPTLDAAAIGTWKQKADFAGEKRSNALGFVINGKGYIMGGNNGSTWLADLYEYDPATDKWTRKADFPVKDRYKTVVMVVGGKAYTGMGLDKNDKLSKKDWYEYDTATDKWTRKNDAGTLNGRVGGIAFGIADKGYFGGGYTNIQANLDEKILVKDLYEYNPATDSWGRGAAAPFLPEETGAFQPFVVANSTPLLITSAKTYEFKPASGVFSDFGISALASELCFTIGKFVYYGLNGNSTLTTIDTEAKLRGNNTNLPAAATARKDGVVFVIGKKAYFGTGINADSKALFNDMFEFSIP